MLRLLLIDQEVQAQIKKVIEYADSHRVTMDDILDVMNGTGTKAGDNKENVLEIQMGYRVVFSIEEQPIGPVRHLSISVDGDVKDMPSVQSVKLIMSEFGFENALENCHVFLEDCKGLGGRKAVNIVELKTN